MRPRMFSRSIFAAMLIVATGCGGGAQPAAAPSVPSTESPITVSIGVSVPLTGPQAVDGQPIANAVQLAVDAANAKGGLPGKVLALIEDDANKPEVATSVANKFCGTTNLIGVIGAFGSGPTSSTLPVYQGCGLAQVSPGATLDDLTERGVGTFFRTTPRNAEHTAQSTEWIANNLNIRTFATIDANDAVTKQIAERITAGLVAKGKQEAVPPTHVSAGQTDFRGALTRIVGATPDLLVVALLISEGGLVVKQARELGFKGIFWGNITHANPKFVDLAGAANAEGMYMYNLGYDPSVWPASAEFVSEYKARFGAVPTTFGANAHDAVSAIIEAWKAAQGSTDRAKIVEQLRKVRFDGTQGPVAFNEKGDLTVARIGIFQVKNGVVTFLGPSTQKK